MKPATDALLNWMKVLYTHDEFTYCDFWHHHVKPRTKVPAASMPQQFRIAQFNVPNWNYENMQDPVMWLNFTTEGNKISVYVWIKRPEVLRALGDDYRKEYTNLKLKDVIDFMAVFKNCMEQQRNQNFGIYYINPYQKDNRISTKDFVKHNPQMVDNHKIFVDTLLDFLTKREKQNQELKKIKGDFK
jgi:hypothetical protein